MINSLSVVELLMGPTPPTLLELRSSLVPAFHASLAKLEQGLPRIQVSSPFFYIHNFCLLVVFLLHRQGTLNELHMPLYLAQDW